jgi:hypothetical protein
MVIIMGEKLGKAIEASSHYWEKPDLASLGKINHPGKRYTVGNMYRGSKSIITAEELLACRVILRAYKRYKAKRGKRFSRKLSK